MNEIFGIPANTLLTILLVLSGLILAAVALSGVFFPLPFRLGVRNLRRRKSQTALVVGGLALSTMIITSALGIGDTIDYSTKSGVYEALGGVDVQLSTNSVESQAGVSFQSGPPQDAGSAGWFDAAVADEVAALVDGETLDASVAAIVQRLPVANSNSNLSEDSVEVRGSGEVSGDGLALLED
jgi:hypothetical protein